MEQIERIVFKPFVGFAASTKTAGKFVGFRNRTQSAYSKLNSTYE